ncbi:MAG TPA: DUF5818 domain-containing protein [Thermoanaerobaculia bacterium]|nr:DUF5818 domain-containing protein [Thermoanaerobaculia bacterium]
MSYRLATLIPILLLASAVFACAFEPARGRDKGGKPIQVRGILTAEGVECQALRSDNGQLYTLTGDLGGFKTGDKVRVKGEIAQVSTCQQGITIAVEKIQEDKQGT